MESNEQRFEFVRRVVLGALGEPRIHRPNAMIYHMDCLEAMRQLPAGLFDLTVTSPPYNIGKSYESTKEVDHYLDWCTGWLSEIGRLSCINGAFWLNVGYLPVPAKGKCVPISYLLWDRVPMFLLQEIVWNYGAGVAARRSFSPRNEKFLWYVGNPNAYTFNLDEVRDPNVKYPNQKKNGRLKCNPLGKNPSDVWQFAKVTSGAGRASPERTPHPAQFPVAVIERIVRACSNQKEVVFDPFMGSGTTAEVAIRTGRFVMGFELKSGYFDIIEKRLDAVSETLVNAQAQRVLPIFKQDAQLATFNFG